MAFNPKSFLNSQAFTVAGGVVIGAGVFTLISGTIENLVRPLFNVVFEQGRIAVNRRDDVYLGCGGFLAAGLIAILCVGTGVVLVKLAGDKSEPPPRA